MSMLRRITYFKTENAEKGTFTFEHDNVSNFVIENNTDKKIFVGKFRFPLQPGRTYNLGDSNTLENWSESFTIEEGATGSVSLYWQIVYEMSELQNRSKNQSRC